MEAKGRVFKYGDNVDTDVIIPARYLNVSSGEELAKYCMIDIDPDFVKKMHKGDIIVATKNFGCGSSREQAPEIIKALGVKAVIAKSFARIFFRNSINNGLLLIENDQLQEDIKEGDTLEIRLNDAIVCHEKSYKIAPLPNNLLEIIEAGGLVNAMRKKNGLDSKE